MQRKTRTLLPTLRLPLFYILPGKTHLWTCAYNGNSSTTSLFIELGANVEAKLYGMSPLRAAVTFGNKVGAVECLISAGAKTDINVFRPRDGIFLKEVCLSDLKIFKVMFNAFVKSENSIMYQVLLNKVLRKTAKAGKNKNLKFILQSGAAEVDNHNSQAIVSAAKKGNTVTIQLLLKYGSHVPDRAFQCVDNYIVNEMLRTGPREKAVNKEPTRRHPRHLFYK